MQNLAKARITGMGKYVPKKLLTNDDLAKMVDTNNEWIVTRTGMKERHIANDEETTSMMGCEAAKEAMAAAKVSPEEIDLLIVATCTPDYGCPGAAPLIQHKLGIQHAGAYDLVAACSGFIYGLSSAKAYVDAGMHKKVLVVAVEKMSSILDYTDRSTCILFGDGAAAAVVSNEGAGLHIQSTCLGSDGSCAELGIVRGGGSCFPATEETVKAGMHKFHMAGREIFKHAVRRMTAAANTCLDEAGMSVDDISVVIPHQANSRIIEAIEKRFGGPNVRVINEVHRYGNTSAASVPLAMYDLFNEETFEVNTHFLLVAFGVGLSWGGAILTKS